MGPKILSVAAESKCTKYLAVRYNFFTAIVHYSIMLIISLVEISFISDYSYDFQIPSFITMKGLDTVESLSAGARGSQDQK